MKKHSRRRARVRGIEKGREKEDRRGRVALHGARGMYTRLYISAGAPFPPAKHGADKSHARFIGPAPLCRASRICGDKPRPVTIGHLTLIRPARTPARCRERVPAFFISTACNETRTSTAKGSRQRAEIVIPFPRAGAVVYVNQPARDGRMENSSY